MTYSWPLMKETINWSDRLKMIKFISTTSRFTNGDKVKEFESNWNNWLGSQNSLFVSSGSTANFLLMAAVKEYYGLKDGDKVLVPSCTWMTNVSPVIQLGLEPVFCDINMFNFSFDKKHLESISMFHKDIKIIFVTHLLGFPSWDENYFKEYFPDAIILDDVCESHGVSRVGEKIGANSIGATFSFYFGHHMTTVEGGMISTNNTDLYDLMKMKRSHGLSRESKRSKEYSLKYKNIDPSFLFITDGYNFRNHEIPAVLGINQLKRLDSMIEKRKNNYCKFINIIKDYEDKFYIPYDLGEDSNFAFPLVARNSKIYKNLKQKLSSSGIEIRPIVSGNLLEHPFLKKYKIENKHTDSLNINTIHNNGLYIGNNHFIKNKDFNNLKNILESL